jgi:hypothetical protein
MKEISTFLEKSKTDKNGLSLYLVGGHLVTIIVKDIEQEVVIGYNRDYDHVLIPISSIVAMAVN